MSINARAKIPVSLRENSSLSKNYSNNKIGINSKNLTDNKNLNFLHGRYYKVSNVLSKNKNKLLAIREAEYDKNLKRIKSNLIDRFNNYSLLNSSINENSENTINHKKKLKRDRSRYNIKQYSPSVINSKKFAHLEMENLDNLKNNNEGFLINNVDLNLKGKNQIFSLRIDDKENNEDDNFYEIENSDSNNKFKKKRYVKKTLNDNNNIFSIDNEYSNFENNFNSNKNNLYLSDKNNEVIQKTEKKNSLMINSNVAFKGTKIKENKFSHLTSNNKNFNKNNPLKGVFSQSKTTKHTNKKFVFKSNFDNTNNSGEDTQLKFSNLRRKIEKDLLLTNKDKENDLNFNKKLNFDNEKNICLNNYETNLNLNQKNEISFEDEIMKDDNIDKLVNKDIFLDNGNDFFNKIENNYKQFIKENFDSEEMKIFQNKDSELNLDLEDKSFLDYSHNTNFKTLQNNDNTETIVLGEENIHNNIKKRITHIRKNSGLEVIQENNNESNNFKNSNNNLDISFNQYNSNNNPILINPNINNSNYFNNTEKSCILESGGLSKKFSEMKRTISNNLNNIQNLNSNVNESDYKLHSMIINNESGKFFASSLINSMESIKNLKQNLKIFSNNLNANNQLINNRELSINRKLDNNYAKSLQNSNINNLNNNLNLSNRFNANLGLSNIDINTQTPDIIYPNNSLHQNKNLNLNNNPYITNNNLISHNNFQNNVSFIPSSNIYNSNNFDLKFNGLNLNSNQLLFNNQMNSNYNSNNYNSNNQIIPNLQMNSINDENIITANNYSLSGKFKNFTNQLTKINLNEFGNNQQNIQYINNTNNLPNSEIKTSVINLKNQTLQDQINLINLSFNNITNNKINKTENIPLDTDNIFSKINICNNDIKMEDNENISIAEKLILFSTEQYRNLLNAFLNYDYGKDILKDFHSKNIEMDPILINHQITERMRSKMVDWMIEVTENYRCDQTTYFLSINLMDKYFSNSANTLNPDDLHIIGVCCMFIASKFYDIFPIKLASASEKISHGKLSKEEIKSFEEKILKTLNYDISNPSAYDFLNFYIEEIFNVYENNYNVKNEVLRDYIRQYTEVDQKRENKFDKNYYQKFTQTKDFDVKFISTLKKILLYLCKMNCYDTSLSVIKPSLLAGSTLLLGVKISEQVLKNNYINNYLLEKIVELSCVDITEIYFIAEKILYNCKNFDKIFPNLNNLKKFYFEFLD